MKNGRLLSKKNMFQTAVKMCVDYRKQQCPRGKYQPEHGGVKCHPCPAGSFNDASAAVECAFCEQGQYSLDESVISRAAVECEQCSSYFSENTTAHKVQQQCELCVPGQYRSKGMCVKREAGLIRLFVTTCIDIDLPTDS